MSENQNKKKGTPIVPSIIVFVVAFIAAMDRLGSDFAPFIKWWLMLLVVGFVFLPLTASVFSNFTAKGYLFSKAFGIVISGYLMWLMASVHLMKFTQAGVVISLVLCAIACYLGPDVYRMIRKKPVEKKKMANLIPDPGKLIFFEVLFFAVFAAYMYMKGFNPKAFGTEKMMDYGFMTSIFRTEYFPVNDFWFTGSNLNYYYFGQYLMTFLTKLSFNRVACGYNLALGMGFTFCVTLVFALVYELCTKRAQAKAQDRSPRYRKAIPYVGGTLGALAVTIAGNVHYLIFAKFVPMMWEILQIPGDKPSYWFPNSTRYIGYMPDVEDKTIHEFPSYSFILGDLHAHVINITFVLAVLGLMYAFLLRRSTVMAGMTKEKSLSLTKEEKKGWMKQIADPAILLLGFFIGIFMMTNYWDFPIYFMVAGFLVLVSNVIYYGFHKEGLFLTGVQAVVVIVLAEIISLPFNLSFEAMTNGIKLAQKHTKFYQLMVLWGLPTLVVLGFIIALISKARKERKFSSDDRKKYPFFFEFLQKLSVSDLYILILGVCAVILIIVPEVMYVVDIYGGSYKRSNTMFKFTYQAYILFGISMGYIFTRFIMTKETRKQWVAGLVAAAIMVMTCGYFTTASKAWFGKISNRNGYKGMAADQFIYTEQPQDAEAIDWLNENVSGQPVVLEANGLSYTIYNRVSVLTGLPTVLGWHTHEWLWNNNLDVVEARSREVDMLYTYEDTTVVKQLLMKYNVEYIFIGSCEYEKFGERMDVNRLAGLGEVAYRGTADENGQEVLIVKVMY